MIVGDFGTAWCLTCRSPQPIADIYDTDEGLEYAGQSRTYVAQPLECGHDAGDARFAPPRRPVRTDPGLVGRLVGLQNAARAAGVLSA